MAIGVLVEVLLPDRGGTSAGGKFPPNDEKDLKEWINPILPGLLNTLQTRGGRILPPPNSLVFYPRSMKFCM